MLREFVLFTSSNLNPSGIYIYIYIYISLSMVPNKYALIAFVRRTSSPSGTVRALSYKYPLVSNKLYTFRRLDY